MKLTLLAAQQSEVAVPLGSQTSHQFPDDCFIVGLDAGCEAIRVTAPNEHKGNPLFAQFHSIIAVQHPRSQDQDPIEGLALQTRAEKAGLLKLCA